MDDAANTKLQLQDGGISTTESPHPHTVSTATQTDKMTYDDIKSVADHLLSQTKIRPEIGIICGSGLGELAEDLDENNVRNVFSYKDIPKFPVTTGVHACVNDTGLEVSYTCMLGGAASHHVSWQSDFLTSKYTHA